MFGFIGGLWLFTDRVAKTTTTVNVGQDASPSKIKKAFDTAATTLNPASHDSLYGTDPRGLVMRYTSVGLGKRFDR